MCIKDPRIRSCAILQRIRCFFFLRFFKWPNFVGTLLEEKKRKKFSSKVKTKSAIKGLDLIMQSEANERPKKMAWEGDT